MKYQNYIFDLYGTLVDIHTDEESLRFWYKISKFFKSNHASYKPEQLKKKYDHLIRKEYKKYSEIEIENVFKSLYSYRGISADKQLIEKTCIFFRQTSREYLRLYPWTLSWLNKLKNEHKNIYLLSNAQHSFTYPEILEIELEDYFDDILISSDCHLKKPDISFYKLLINKHQLDIHKSIMIGNDIICDIQGAKKTGLDTYYIHTNISPAYDDSIKSDYCILDPDTQDPILP